ncbi:MAG: MATE family efflux transporter [Prevotellaceae bacterium]|jgi:putative MATE family efflux protein|nr:MATE family efflux transporter [Prevotellaceae bacterium]
MNLTSNKNIFNIAYPVCLTLIAQNIINVTDTAFLGHLSETALGASAIAGMFYIAVYVVGFGFSQGAQILIGRRNGEKDYEKIGLIFNNGLFFNFLLSIIIFTFSFFYISQIIRFLVTSNEVYNAVIEYLDWRIYGFFFSFLNIMFRSLYVGITQTRVLTVSAVITSVTNVFFDYAMIFGNCGFPELGIAGAAIASVIAEVVTFLFLLGYTLLKMDTKRYVLFYFSKTDWKVIKQMLNLSIFIMFQFLISTSTWFLFFIFIEHMGERPLAITNIGRSLYMLLMIPGIALSTTISTLVSNLIGSGRKNEVLPFINRMIKITLIAVIPFTVFTFVFPELIVQIYTDDIDLIRASAPVIRVVSAAMIFCAVGNMIFNSVSGTGNTRTAFLIEFVTMFFYITYIYYTAIVYPSTTAVVWLSEFVYWILIGGSGYYYLKKGNWQKKEI